MNANHNPNVTPTTSTPEKDNPTICDLEMVFTAQVTIIERDVEIGKVCNLLEFAATIEEDIKKFFASRASDLRLDDDKIKVQFFLHEKNEKNAKTE